MRLTNNQKFTFREWLGLPVLAWMLFFVFAPLILDLVVSFAQRGLYGGIDWNFQLQNYVRLFDPIYLKIIIHSVQLALATTALCLLLAFPIAWLFFALKESNRKIAVLLVFAPFLMNFLIRIFSIKLMFGFDGPIIWICHLLAIEVDPYIISQNQFLVMMVMVTTYIPLMIFSIYGAMEKIDLHQIEAAIDLGADWLTVVYKILWPQTRSSVANGFMLVFIPALGEYLIPDLLGGAKNMLIGNLITEQFLKSRDWPFGAALSVVLILSFALISYGLQRWGGMRE